MHKCWKLNTEKLVSGKCWQPICWLCLPGLCIIPGSAPNPLAMSPSFPARSPVRFPACEHPAVRHRWTWRLWTPWTDSSDLVGCVRVVCASSRGALLRRWVRRRAPPHAFFRRRFFLVSQALERGPVWLCPLWPSCGNGRVGPEPRREWSTISIFLLEGGVYFIVAYANLRLFVWKSFLFLISIADLVHNVAMYESPHKKTEKSHRNE